MTGFWELVTRRAERTPGAVLLLDDRGRELTALGLRDAAERVAAGLASDHGVGAGTRVMWQLPTTLESVILCAALARLGAVQNPLIATLREAEIRALDRQFRPELAVVPTRWRGFDHAAAARAISGAAVLVCDHRESPGLALPEGDPAALPPPPAADGPRWVFTTSGSTAAPKAVRHTDASASASSNAMVEQFGIGPTDVFPMAFPFAHIGGLAWLVTALRTGCRLLLIDTFDPVASPAAMAKDGVTVLGSATPFFQAYLAAQRAHGPAPLFGRLRFCMGGGAPIPPGLDEQVRRELGGLGIANGYGLTEFPIAGFPPLGDTAATGSSSWRPGPGVEARIIAGDGTVCGAGLEGELRLRGPQLFAGYLDPDPAALDGEGYLRTGDLAVLDDRGLVRITGRIKEIVVRGGENVSVAEVEAVLATHPSVGDVAVVGYADPDLGERCCAVVVVAAGAVAPTLAELADHCHTAGLARFKNPERLVLADSVPRNAMGKIQRAQLAV